VRCGGLEHQRGGGWLPIDRGQKRTTPPGRNMIAWRRCVFQSGPSKSPARICQHEAYQGSTDSVSVRLPGKDVQRTNEGKPAKWAVVPERFECETSHCSGDSDEACAIKPCLIKTGLIKSRLIRSRLGDRELTNRRRA
jgi:hypothetical protein